MKLKKQLKKKKESSYKVGEKVWTSFLAYDM